jgi:hypothetical protein
MVSIGQRTGLQLIVLGILLQAANPLFYSAAKPGTDFETLVGYAIGDHGGYLEAGIPEDGKIIQCRLRFFLLVPILENGSPGRQITVDSSLRNALSENCTTLG